MTFEPSALKTWTTPPCREPLSTYTLPVVGATATPLGFASCPIPPPPLPLVLQLGWPASPSGPQRWNPPPPLVATSQPQASSNSPSKLYRATLFPDSATVYRVPAGTPPAPPGLTAIPET